MRLSSAEPYICRNASERAGRIALFASSTERSTLQVLLDGQFGIQNRVSTCKRDSRPHSHGIEKNNPFPATWICRLNDFELNRLVLHGRSLKVRRSDEIPIQTHIEARL